MWLKNEKKKFRKKNKEKKYSNLLFIFNLPIKNIKIIKYIILAGKPNEKVSIFFKTK